MSGGGGSFVTAADAPQVELERRRIWRFDTYAPLTTYVTFCSPRIELTDVRETVAKVLREERDAVGNLEIGAAAVHLFNALDVRLRPHNVFPTKVLFLAAGEGASAGFDP